jgi:hypothetical protein
MRRVLQSHAISETEEQSQSIVNLQVAIPVHDSMQTISTMADGRGILQ